MDLKAVQETLEKINTGMQASAIELKGLVSKQDEEIKKQGETTKSTAEALTKATEALDQLKADFAAEQEKIKEIQLEINRSLEDDAEEFKTAGQIFAGSEQLTQMLKGKHKNSDVLNLKDIHIGRPKVKALSSITALGNRIVEPHRAPTVIIPDQKLTIRSLLTEVSTTRDAIQYVKETGHSPLYTELAVAATAGASQITVKNAGGFYVGTGGGVQKINIAGTEYEVTAVDFDNNLIDITPNLAANAAIGEAVTSNIFTGTPETLIKPQADLNLELFTESVKTMAHWIPAPKQILADEPSLSNYIDSRLLYGLDLAFERNILYGAGNDREFQGILTDADRQIYQWSTGTAGDTQIDAIRRAMTLVDLANFPVNGVVVHPRDWEQIELIKGTDSHYVWINVQEGGSSRLWRVNVVDTASIAQGTAVLGAWNIAGTLYNREDSSIDVAEQHEEFFIKNMVAIRAEERLGWTLQNPNSFCEVQFDAAP